MKYSLAWVNQQCSSFKKHDCETRSHDFFSNLFVFCEKSKSSLTLCHYLLKRTKLVESLWDMIVKLSVMNFSMECVSMTATLELWVKKWKKMFTSICLFFVRNQSRHMLFVTTYSNVQSSLVVWCAKVTRRRSELSEQLSPRSLINGYFWLCIMK